MMYRYSTWNKVRHDGIPSKKTYSSRRLLLGHGVSARELKCPPWTVNSKIIVKNKTKNWFYFIFSINIGGLSAYFKKSWRTNIHCYGKKDRYSKKTILKSILENRFCILFSRTLEYFFFINFFMFVENSWFVIF